MAYYTSKTIYFKDRLLIPNLVDTGFAGTAIQEQLGRYVAKYETEYLKLMLGDTLYAAFMGGLGTVPIPPKWTALKAQIWNDTEAISPCANYIFYHWFRDKVMLVTGIGDGQAKGQNFDMRINEQRAADVWNDMVALNEDLDEWIAARPTDYAIYVTDESLHTPVNIFNL